MDRVELPCGRSTRKSAMSWARSSKETSDELRRMWIDPRRMRTLQSEIREQGPFRLYTEDEETGFPSVCFALARGRKRGNVGRTWQMILTSRRSPPTRGSGQVMVLRRHERCSVSLVGGPARAESISVEGETVRQRKD